MAKLWHSIWGSLNQISLFRTDIHSCNPCMSMQGVWRTCKFLCNLQAAIAFVKCILGRLRLVTFFYTEGKDSGIFLSSVAQIFLKKASRQDLWPDSGLDARLGEGFLFGIVSSCLVAVAVWTPSQFHSQLIDWKLWSVTARAPTSQLKLDQKQPRVKQLHSCVGGDVWSTTKDLGDLLSSQTAEITQRQNVHVTK